MRGINHQNIFEEQEDYYQFLNTLDMMAQSYEPDGTPSGRNYILYAYCLMTNHIHLLIREREDTIGMERGDGFPVSRIIGVSNNQ